VRLDGQGRVVDFVMNDRCAAGTGRFLEVVAERLDVELEQLGELAESSRSPAQISSMCVVFAETEIIGLLASGAAPADIVAGVQSSIASRVAAMAAGRLDRPVVFTGGVARIGGMVRAVARHVQADLVVPDQPELTGALGAALIAADRIRKS
jgi:predicted CoA-substrate-specific enzyme activase